MSKLPGGTKKEDVMNVEVSLITLVKLLVFLYGSIFELYTYSKIGTDLALWAF